MTTNNFVSFHYQRDHARVQQVLNMGAIEGQQIMSAQAWESVKRNGDDAIRKWIEGQMKGKSAVVVLVGRETASRRWVKYEITKAWNEKKPLVGVRINGLKDFAGSTDYPGDNPFDRVQTTSGTPLSTYVPLYSPSGVDSRTVYKNIDDNLAAWVASAYARS